jgi:hypothetical protein
MNRQEFLRSAVGLGLGISALAACGSDDGGDDGGKDAPGARDCLMNGTNAQIGQNHGHTLSVSVADLTAGVDKTYGITGSSGHSHQVTITAAMFTMLKANTGISVTSSSGGGHTHTVTVACL